MPSQDPAVRPYAFLADRDIPDLHVVAGDVVIVTPSAEEPVVLSHELAVGYERVLAEAERGALRLVNDDRRPRDLAAAVGLAAPPKAGRHGARAPTRRRGAARLELVR